MAILTEALRSFSQAFQVYQAKNVKLRHDRFLPRPLKEGKLIPRLN
jgi:hypothetical protein